MIVFGMPYVVMFILREHLKPFLQKRYELIGHFVQLVEIVVGIDKTVPGANRIVDEKEVREFVPGAIVGHQGFLILRPEGANLHHCAIFRTAPGTAVQPNNGSLPVGNVLVPEMPEE